MKTAISQLKQRKHFFKLKLQKVTLNECVCHFLYAAPRQMNGVYLSGPPYRILLSEWLHDIQHNDNQHNGLICNTAFMIFSINDIEHNIFGVIMLSVITLSVIMLNVATPSE
jgi:hypothetical protein